MNAPALSSVAWNLALVGNPNCGKTALFNLLTGARQKVANYAGVTVERKTGMLRLADGRTVAVVDLPGVYSLTPTTPDEEVTLEVIDGRREGEDHVDGIVAVVDATNLRMNLRRGQHAHGGKKRADGDAGAETLHRAMAAACRTPGGERQRRGQRALGMIKLIQRNGTGFKTNGSIGALSGTAQ